MEIYRCYLKTTNSNNISIINEVLDQQFQNNYEIEWDKNLALLSAFDVPSFIYILSNVAKLLFSDAGINIVFLVVPKFNYLFLKYINNIDNKVYTAYDLFLSNIDNDFVLKDAKELLKNINRDLLITASVYLKCNLNSNEAAKVLYLHRNSFSYRLNKFIDVSDMDIKNYTNAKFIDLLFKILKI